MTSGVTRCRTAATTFFTLVLMTGAACAPRDDHATGTGRALVVATSSEYRFPAAVDAQVLADRATELWARVYRPETLVEGKRYPLLLFLHGNHGTCGTGENPRRDDSAQYTATGTCPPNYVVTPNHEGYGYVAEELARQEYVVVSINANRGITAGPGIAGDNGLVLARGRLVLQHLARLSRWNRGVEATPASVGVSLQDRLDFSQVGLVGHSRGGEGMRAAYVQYRDPGSPWPGRIADPVAVRALAEIAPVDGQSRRILDVDGVPWLVLLSMCDDDVFNLQGIRALDRVLTTTAEEPPAFKASFTVWGGNHNYYNSEWQLSDSGGCFGHQPLFATAPGTTGSPAQRAVALTTLVGFFQATLGTGEVPAENLFDPRQPLPAAVTEITRVDRGYSPSPDADVSTHLEEFLFQAGVSSTGQPNVHSNVGVVHSPLPEHDINVQGASVLWLAPGPSTFFQVNFAEPGAGVSLVGRDTLDFRVDRQSDVRNPANEATDFSVHLVNADDSLSGPVSVAAHVSLVGPVGSLRVRHSMLQTARIRLGDFAGANLESIRGVRFVFDRTPSGRIFLANIRAVGARTPEPVDDPPVSPPPPPPPPAPPAIDPAARGRAWRPRPAAPVAVPPTEVVAVGNGVVTLRPAAGEIELVADAPFPIRDELLALTIGSTTVSLSRHPDPADLRRVVFTLSPEQVGQVAPGDPVVARYGPHSTVAWDFGQLAIDPN